jgi:hypothetical protein
VLAALERQPGSEAKARAYQAKAKKLGKAHVDTLIRGRTPAGPARRATPRRARRLRRPAAGQRAPRATPTPCAAAPAPTRRPGPPRPDRPSKVFFDKGKAVHGTYFSAGTAKDGE